MLSLTNEFLIAPHAFPFRRRFDSPMDTQFSIKVVLFKLEAAWSCYIGPSLSFRTRFVALAFAAAARSWHQDDFERHIVAAVISAGIRRTSLGGLTPLHSLCGFRGLV